MSGIVKLYNERNIRKVYQIAKCSNLLAQRHLSVLTIRHTVPYINHQSSAVNPQLFVDNNKSQYKIEINCFSVKQNQHDNDEFRKREEEKEREYNEKETVQKPKVREATDEEKQKFEEVRKQILTAALSFVPVHGWTRTSIVKGAESVGYPGVSHGMFSNGPIELTHFFYMESNRKTVEYMKQRIRDNENTPKDGTDSKKVKETLSPTEFAKDAIKFRLTLLQPYTKTWPQAISFMGLPHNATRSLSIILTFIDDICYYSGDRSVDFGWYVRRVGLAGIYKITELFMVQDKSAGYKDTWEFLDRRFEDGINLHNIFDLAGGDGKKTENLERVLGSAFSTARNMLGLDYNRR